MVERKNSEERSSLSVAVGERLRERRNEEGLSLRDVAATAAISPGHLSEIENGRSHASLPVLLRLGRILHYPLAEMLSRITGHRVRTTTIPAAAPSNADLSHDGLELEIRSLGLRPDEIHSQDLRSDHDTFVYVIDGEVALTVDGTTYDLGPRDAADVERAAHLELKAQTDCIVLVATCPRE